MKAKSAVKPNRRIAGLQIHATLEPRPDLGANLASDIFRAVKENEAAEHEAKNQIILDEAQSASAEREVKFEPTTKIQEIAEDFDSLENEMETIAGNALVRFGSGQMRVVSLQPPKPRKIQKKPRKLLKVISDAREIEKIPRLFERTKAEELYDLLFQLTLGADEPCASVRVRRSDLMSHTNINTRITLDLNLKRLEENGLLKIESRPGEQEGNIYTVFPLPNVENR